MQLSPGLFLLKSPGDFLWGRGDLKKLRPKLKMSCPKLKKPCPLEKIMWYNAQS